MAGNSGYRRRLKLPERKIGIIMTGKSFREENSLATQVRNDEELGKLLAGVIIAHAGVLPNICSVLVPQRSEKTSTEPKDFSNVLHQLPMRRYNILLAQPLKASPPLVAAAKSYIQPMVSGSENVTVGQNVYNAERNGDSMYKGFKFKSAKQPVKCTHISNQISIIVQMLYPN
ncbi:hypothetical protein V6N12_015845 [Hibiscus sabdariffa]|uniref:Histone H2A C-terminal domain-containing protein n=1 Tax=Hibiscus sabdariffa TaxID=183260 RepID=A0ABR2DPC7_9ROSI